MVPIMIKRIYFDKLASEKSEPEVSILLGARQVGKSTLMRQLEQKVIENGEQSAFYDLEQPSSLQRLAGSPDNVIKELCSGARVIFIDEFHYLKNASKIFKAIYDSGKKIKIYASGSSSLEIHRHLQESLAGRFRKTLIFPPTVSEWQQVKDFEANHYLQWGGMPKLIDRQDETIRADALENIVSTYITKDIKGLVQEENIRAFNSLLYLLAQSQGSVVVTANLAKETGLNQSTVSRYLDIMSQTYVLYPVMSYSNNLANELKKSKKFYLFDLGIRNSLLKDFRPAALRPDKGTLFESAVLQQLLPQLKPNMEIRFWRTKKGNEVDFVLVKNRLPVPVEVKSSLSTDKVPRGMRRFLDLYPDAPYGIVFNNQNEGKINCSGRIVYFKKWFESSEVDYLKEIV